METLDLRPGYRISRIIRGNWQLAGGHGVVDEERALDDLLVAFDAGLTTFDCADIYTGVEALLGRFRHHLRQHRGAEALARLRIHTKLVPDLTLLPRLTAADLAMTVDESLRRLGVAQLDLVQFHWWDYAVPGVEEAMRAVEELRRAGKIALVGATNFDTAHVRAFVEAGVPLATLQVQYSLLDSRPATGLAAFCQTHAVSLLCYGTVAGGFLGDAWLGRPEPREPLENRSLTKYKLIIDDFGGWEAFQDLLRACRSVADRHGTDIATVASRMVLDRAGVGAVIVGGRTRAHIAANAAVAALALEASDRAAIDAITVRAQGPHGEVYALERDRDGRHGRIMKYNLNTAAG